MQFPWHIILLERLIRAGKKMDAQNQSPCLIKLNQEMTEKNPFCSFFPKYWKFRKLVFMIVFGIVTFSLFYIFYWKIDLMVLLFLEGKTYVWIIYPKAGLITIGCPICPRLSGKGTTPKITFTLKILNIFNLTC